MTAPCFQLSFTELLQLAGFGSRFSIGSKAFQGEDWRFLFGKLHGVFGETAEENTSKSGGDFCDSCHLFHHHFAVCVYTKKIKEAWFPNINQPKTFIQTCLASFGGLPNAEAIIFDVVRRLFWSQSSMNRPWFCSQHCSTVEIIAANTSVSCCGTKM